MWHCFKNFCSFPSVYLPTPGSAPCCLHSFVICLPIWWGECLLLDCLFQNHVSYLWNFTFPYTFQNEFMEFFKKSPWKFDEIVLNVQINLRSIDIIPVFLYLFRLSFMYFNRIFLVSVLKRSYIVSSQIHCNFCCYCKWHLTFQFIIASIEGYYCFCRFIL